MGVVTQQGWRDFVFMSEEDLNWENTLDKLLAGGRKSLLVIERVTMIKETFTASSCIQPDTTGTGYTIPCVPGLQEQGDDLTLPRAIDYYATLPTEVAARDWRKILLHYRMA